MRNWNRDLVSQYARLIVLWAILMLAAVLRFQNLNAIEHNVDHAYPIWQALMTLDRGVFPVTGQGTSVLFANPALTGYLFLPFVALTRSPIGAYLFVITLNTVAVWLLYRAALLLLDVNQALIAAFLMAVNPWVIEYSRTTWVQSLLPFFTCLIFYLLLPILLGTAKKPGQRILWVFIAVTLATQTYLLAFAVVVPVLLLLIIFRKRLPRRAVLIGTIIFVIVTGIYMLGLYANRDDTLARLHSFTSGAPAYVNPTAWMHAVRLVSGQDYPISRGMTAPISDADLRQQLSALVHDTLLIALLAGIVTAIYGIFVRTADRSLIVLIWFFVPIAMLSYTGQPVHPYYLLLTLPAGYLLAAWGIGLFWRWRLGGAITVLVSLFIAVLMSVNVLRFAENTLARPGAHDLSAVPVGVGMDIVHALIPSASRGSTVFAKVSDNDWVLDSLAGSVFPANGDIDTQRITYLPQNGGTYLLLGDAQPPLFVDKRQSFTMDDGTLVTAYHVNPTLLPIQDKPITSDKGISYLKWQIEEPLTPGATASVLIYWRIDALKPERFGWLLSPFIHVADATGLQIANRGVAGVPGALWQLGDIYVERISIPIPANAVPPFTLQIGQFDGVHNINALFTLADGSVNSAVTVTLP